MEKTYLGDAVYVFFDGDGTLWLETSNGLRTTNRVAMEPAVLTAFLGYLEFHSDKFEQKEDGGDLQPPG